MIGLFFGGGDSFGGIIILGVWVILGDEDGMVSRDDIVRGDEMRFVDGGWVGAVLEGIYGRELVEGVGVRFGEVIYGSKDDDVGIM